MSEPRSSQVYDALNHQPLLCGIKREYFIAIAGITMILFTTSKQLILSIVLGFVAYLAITIVSRKEPNYITLYLAARRLPKSYDPGKYKPTKVTES
jgi:type IV secretory pathway VirB3-like protein